MRRLLRLTTTTALSVVAVPLVVLLPTAGGPALPHPVRMDLQSLRLTADAVAAASPRRPRSVPHRLPELRTRRFSLVGVTWGPADRDLDVSLSVRTRAGGQWTDWHELGGLDDVEPDPGSRDDRRAGERPGTAPYWVGPSDGVQVRVDRPTGRMPRDLRVELVDPGSSAADADLGEQVPDAAEASPSRPAILTRAQWGADESLRDGSPDYAPPVRVGFVHHTDTTNSYAKSQSAAIIRSVYAFHTKGRGWSDIGYNFLVDKYGRIFEGRAGGVDRAVVGAHTGGFNSHSFAGSLLGDYTSTAPTGSQLSALAKLFAWKLSLGYLDPLGTGRLTSSGGGTSRYDAGKGVTFKTVSGHRDAGYTACPGNAGYRTLGSVRSRIAALMGAAFVAPSSTPASRGMLDDGAFTVSARVVGPLTWTLTAIDRASGKVARTLTGTANRGTPVRAVWNHRDSAGVPVPPGSYELRLTARAGSTTARPWSSLVRVTSPVSVAGPALAAWGSTLTLAGKAPADSLVELQTQRAGTSSWLNGPVARAGPDGRFTMSLPVDEDVRYYAVSGRYRSATTGTRLGPVFTAPAWVAYRAPISVRGGSRPSEAVSFRARRPGAATWTTTRALTADPGGHWATSLPGSGNWELAAVAGGVATPARQVRIGPVVDAPAPGSATLGSPVRVAGTALPGSTVRLQTRRVGTTSWAAASSTTTAASGRWSGSFALPDDVEYRATSNTIGTPAAGPVRVSPTATAPARAGWKTVVPVTGTARPGSTVTLWTASGNASPTAVATTKASGAGRWSAGFRLLEPTRWAAASNGFTSPQGRTMVAPTFTAPAVAAFATTVPVTGTAPPGSSVTVRVMRAGESAYSTVATTTAGSAGAWATRVFVGEADLRVYPAADGVAARSRAVRAMPATLEAPLASTLGATVRVTGTARPGAAVEVNLLRRTASRWSRLTTVTAGTTGAWSATYRATDDTRAQARTGEGLSISRLTKLGPTLVAPATVRSGSTARLSGTTRPGAVVSVFVRRSSETSYVVRRRVTADSRGAWATTWPATSAFRVYATSNGLRSGVRAVAMS